MKFNIKEHWSDIIILGLFFILLLSLIINVFYYNDFRNNCSDSCQENGFESGSPKTKIMRSNYGFLYFLVPGITFFDEIEHCYCESTINKTIEFK